MQKTTVIKTIVKQFESKPPVEKQKSLGLVTLSAPVMAPPPPPPPSLPPPPPTSKPPAIAKLRTTAKPKPEVTKLGMDQPVINLQSLLETRNRLNSNANANTKQSRLPSKMGLNISMNDLTTVQLRRTIRPSIKPEKQAMQLPVEQPSFKLRNTGVLRSPGGTPMKENICMNAESPANILTNALINKFKHTRSSPQQPSKPSSLKTQSPFSSPAAGARLSSPLRQ